MNNTNPYEATSNQPPIESSAFPEFHVEFQITREETQRIVRKTLRVEIPWGSLLAGGVFVAWLLLALPINHVLLAAIIFCVILSILPKRIPQLRPFLCLRVYSGPRGSQWTLPSQSQIVVSSSNNILQIAETSSVETESWASTKYLGIKNSKHGTVLLSLQFPILTIPRKAIPESLGQEFEAFASRQRLFLAMLPNPDTTSQEVELPLIPDGGEVFEGAISIANVNEARRVFRIKRLPSSALGLLTANLKLSLILLSVAMLCAWLLSIGQMIFGGLTLLYLLMIYSALAMSMFRARRTRIPIRGSIHADKIWLERIGVVSQIGLANWQILLRQDKAYLCIPDSQTVLLIDRSWFLSSESWERAKQNLSLVEQGGSIKQI